jgi:Family of unknown function (DUF6789)
LRQRDVVDIQPDRAILAGLIATLVVSILFFMSPLFGVTRPDAVSLLGTTYVGAKLHTDQTAIEILGLFFQVIVGAVIVALIYPHLFPYLPGRGVQKGICLGVLLWLVGQIVTVPLLGGGFFGLEASIAAPIVSLLGHVLYGAILATIYGHPVAGEQV